MVVAGGLLWKRPWAGETGPRPFPPGAQAQLAQQFSALSAATGERGVARAAGSSSFAARLWQSRRSLGVLTPSFEYVRGATAPDRADGSALAVTRVEWTESPGSVFGAGRHSALVGVRVMSRGAAFAMRDVEPVGSAVPPWLAGDIARRRSHGVDLIGIDGGGSELLLRRLQIAAATVREVGPRTSSSLVVVAPGTIAESAAILGQKPGDISQIAAVTTRLDAADRRAPTVIVLNPQQFQTMDAHARQVVLTHEATHQMTDAVGRGGEAWVVEGFADFVALHDDDRPVSANAAQALATVRENGPPKALPARGDYANSTHGLGALYEATWLIFRMLAERHGDKAVVDFYDAILAGAPTSRALHDAFGITAAQLTTQWQSYLRKLAASA